MFKNNFICLKLMMMSYLFGERINEHNHREKILNYDESSFICLIEKSIVNKC